MKNKIFKTSRLPFLELRFIDKVTSCNKKHKHDELTITAIKTGNINIVFNDKSDLLKPNEISIINPNEVHCATLTKIESFSCYVLYLDEAWCQSIQQSLFNHQLNFIDIKNSLVKNPIIFNNFIQLCDDLLDKHISFLEKEEKLIYFMSNLFLDFCIIPRNSDCEAKNSRLAIKIKNYLLENIEDDIVLKDISKHMNLSIVHILRIFKKEFGLPVHSYLLNKKVHLAKELLSENMSMVEVAQMSGFFDQSHLNKSFKRVFQLTPKEYQKNIFS